MNAPANPSPSNHSAFLPVLLLALALIGLLTWQFVNASRQRSALKQVEQSRAATVAQSKAVQADLERLCTGLLELAQTDPAARELVQRFGITRSTPAPAAK